MKTEVYDGLQPYGEILERQRALFEVMVAEKRANGKVREEHLIMVEHTPVITLGKHAKTENLLFSVESLQKRGIEVFRIERGGDVTFHGPGQLVVYPLIDLEAYHLGIKKYIELLEEAVIRTIGEYGIIGERVEGATGVWIGKDTPAERKICAIGVKCCRYVTMHGLALNVNTDLSAFTLINPCGFIDKGVTSICRETGGAVDLREVAGRLQFHLLSLLHNISERKMQRDSNP
ncbi:MAG: lipoyl(octanoyl) transferase LipB [Muribaculaceae bacterium]|nr:lipoyl(octanoyl) transferase LipB [Muribaculaceae bacterium]